MEHKFICNTCGAETNIPPAHKNATCQRCGRGRLRIFIKCLTCEKWFNPSHYARQYCSYPCKVKAQSTGRKCTRKTITKARSAQSLLAYHIKQGHIIRPDSCEECGNVGQRIEGAHYNYDEPLKVRWLCRSCHIKWDKHSHKNVTVRVALPAAP